MKRLIQYTKFYMYFIILLVLFVFASGLVFGPSILAYLLILPYSFVWAIISMFLVMPIGLFLAEKYGNLADEMARPYILDPMYKIMAEMENEK